MMLGAEDGCNHPQPTGSNRPLICGQEACFGAFWGVWDACIKRNVKTTLPAPPSVAPNHLLVLEEVTRVHVDEFLLPEVPQGRLGPPGRVGGARSVQVRVLGCGSLVARCRASQKCLCASRSMGFRPIGDADRHLRVLVRPTSASMAASLAVASRRLGCKFWLMRSKQLHRVLLNPPGFRSARALVEPPLLLRVVAYRQLGRRVVWWPVQPCWWWG